MDRSNPSAKESASEVSAALVPRTAELAADIYQLIVREITALCGDQRILALLEASVAGNVATMLHILQHDIDLENVGAPAAAEEYARRLAQHGVPVAALLRAGSGSSCAPVRLDRRCSHGQEGGAMSQDRQWVIDLLRRLGYTQAAEEAARELPDPVSMEEIKKFGDRHGISHDEIMSQMGGSP
jgi:hypothetical protein